MFEMGVVRTFAYPLAHHGSVGLCALRELERRFESERNICICQQVRRNIYPSNHDWPRCRRCSSCNTGNVMMSTPGWVGDDEKEASGGFMGMCLVAGIATGSFASFLIVNV
ncbi:hypothetical protein HOY80DRAFT_653755 [Tuber brumale]|nr:hypothetical protein HOY80DRAFT_653755 [Tuber brumale]